VVRVQAGDRVLLEETVAISPAKPYRKDVMIPAGTDVHTVRAALLENGRELIAYSPVNLPPMPQPAIYTPPPAPKDIANAEELVLAGQRADQFHSPSLDADPFWEEALRRDPGDIEANTGMGRLALRRAKYAEAEAYFRKAIDRLTAKYTTPKNAEPLYYLGLALRGQGKDDAAYDAFFKATWSQEWKSPAYFSLAEIAASRGDANAVLQFANAAIDANPLNVRAYALKPVALRYFGLSNDALDAIRLARKKADPLDPRLLAEEWLALKFDDAEQPAETRRLFATLNEFPSAAEQLAAEYARAGLWRDGADVLEQAVKTGGNVAKSPIVRYYLAEFADRLGRTAAVAENRRAAMAASPAYVFPFQAELIPVLRRAMAANPRDARAPYYLGNLLFDWQPDEAVALWEKSAALDPTLPVVWRNLAQAYAHQPGGNSRAKAIAALEKAVVLPGADATQFAELDQLYEAAGAPVEKRLALLERHEALAITKDEGRASLVGLKTFAGRPDEAIRLLQDRTFSVWEGGTRFNTGEAWTDAHVARGIQRFNAKQFTDALADFEAAPRYPANLRAAERVGGNARQPEISYWIGRAQEALGHADQARAAWQQAAADNGAGQLGGRRGGGRGFGSPLAGRAGRYYQALALRELGENARADALLRDLVTAGSSALTPAANEAVDPNNSNFANRESAQSRTAMAHYIAGLGHAGLGEKDKARAELEAALAGTPDLLGARLALDQL
jgi:tetratricopeptide (TPR) repeat protein